MALGKERKIVCVTGASGFVASWVVKRLLEAGYHVRGTVRDPGSPKVSHLWSLPGAKERLELFQADLLTEGSYDTIVDGCQGVFHIAAAVKFDSENPQEDIVDPSLRGTLNVLRSCKRSSTVKRVVYTSSSVTVLLNDGFPENHVLDESAWSSIDLCRQLNIWYGVGKTLAEQAALEFGEKEDLEVVTVVPPFIVGELLPATPTASMAEVVALLQGRALMFPFQHMGYVHLDDVASAHILVYESPDAKGRYLCVGARATNRELLEFLAGRYPEYKDFLPELEAFGAQWKGLSSKRFNTDKLQALGLRFKGLGEMFDDGIASLKSKQLV